MTKRSLVANAAVVFACAVGLDAGQNAPASQPTSFEAASVKPNTSGEPGTSIRRQPGGRFNAVNAPLRSLITLAYQLQGFQLAGGLVARQRPFGTSGTQCGRPHGADRGLGLRAAVCAGSITGTTARWRRRAAGRSRRAVALHGLAGAARVEARVHEGTGGSAACRQCRPPDARLTSTGRPPEGGTCGQRDSCCKARSMRRSGTSHMIATPA